MRRNLFWIGLLALVAVVFANQPAEAYRLMTLNRVEGPFETTVAVASTSSLGNFGPGQLIYGFNVRTSAAAGVAGLYDTGNLGLATRTQGIYIDEGGAASSGDTFQSDWPAPYTLVTDLTVIVTDAAVTIYHDRIV